MIYLDNAATTPVRREVLEAMWPYLTGEFGNPSSSHSMGEQAARALAKARESVAGVLGCRPAEVVFTSGGTESNNAALKGVALATPRGRHIITSPIEHEAVLESCHYLERHHGFEVTMLAVDGHGSVGAASIARALREDTTLVSIMYANNEVGTVQPISELAAEARRVGARMHTDAVQAAGWLPVDVAALGVDTMALSGHKLGAPKGTGVLYQRRGVQAEPLIHGGGQERGRRSGTENLAGAVGFAEALVLAEAERAESAQRIAALRNEFVARVLAEVPGAVLTGHREYRLPANASFCFSGTSGEAVLLELDRDGIVCSSGSACAAGSDEPSHVLVAMGIPPEIAQTAVRFTLSATTSREELDRTVVAVRSAVERISALSG